MHNASHQNSAQKQRNRNPSASRKQWNKKNRIEDDKQQRHMLQPVLISSPQTSDMEAENCTKINESDIVQEREDDQGQEKSSLNTELEMVLKQKKTDKLAEKRNKWKSEKQQKMPNSNVGMDLDLKAQLDEITSSILDTKLIGTSQEVEKKDTSQVFKNRRSFAMANDAAEEAKHFVIHDIVPGDDAKRHANTFKTKKKDTSGILSKKDIIFKNQIKRA